MSGYLCCFYCPEAMFRTVDRLLIHLQKQCVRRYNQPENALTWPCGNCTSQFGGRNSLRRHVVDRHVPSVPPLTPPRPCLRSPSRYGPPSPFKTPTKSLPPPSPVHMMSPKVARNTKVPTTLKDVEVYLRDQLAALVASFHSTPGMTEKSVQMFVKSFNSFQQDVLYGALHRLTDHYETLNKSCEHLHDFLNTFKVIMENCTGPLRSIHLRLKHFTQLGTYIAPESVFFTRSDKRSRHGLTQKVVVGQFVPTRLLLAKLLSIPGLMNEMEQYRESTFDPDGGICHFMHSPNWLNMVSNHQDQDGVIWLPIHVYFDEFEAGNPLGSRAGKNKLGAVYFSLPSLPYCYASQIKFIFLMMLFRASDKGLLQVDVPDEDVLVGNTVFNRVIEELNYLQEFGVVVQLSPFKTVTVKFMTACLLGDNLGLNQICGFVESFTSPHCCRVCTDDFKTAPFIEDPTSLRNPDNYREALELNNSTLTGIKEKCIWLNVRGFDLFANTNPDHMHDFLEGTCYYVMFEVISGLINTVPTFTMSNLNMRVKNFAFGPESNVPGEIHLTKETRGGKVRKMSANEMRVFVSYFGLIVGDLIPDIDDEDTTQTAVRKPGVRMARSFYELYLMLIKVQELITSRLVTPQVTDALRLAVNDLNTAYLQLSNRTYVPPKMHFLIHYPTAMSRNGPSISLSSMNYEKKHKELKRALTSIASTVNTPLSAAKKIMLIVNSLLTANELPPKTFKPGVLTSVHPSDVAHLKTTMGLPDDALFKKTKRVESPNSVVYSENSIICSGFVDDPIHGCFPHFLKIVNIYFCSRYNLAIAVGMPFTTLGWSRHFHAYHVKHIYTLDSAGYVDLSTLEYPFPNTLCAARNGEHYIFMRNSTAHFTYSSL